MMNPWARDMGYPVVQLISETYNAATKKMTIEVEQRRFLASGDWTDKEAETGTIWTIPLCIVTDISGGKELGLVLKGKKGKFEFDVGNDGWYKIKYVP